MKQLLLLKLEGDPGNLIEIKILGDNEGIKEIHITATRNGIIPLVITENLGKAIKKGLAGVQGLNRWKIKEIKLTPHEDLKDLIKLIGGH